MGNNDSGQLGDETTTRRSSPVQVSSAVSLVAVGESHTLFLKMDGTLWASGFSAFGQLGDGTTISRTTPVQIASRVSAIAAGRDHSLFVTQANVLPSFIMQPSSQAALVGATVMFSVQVDGTPLISYQWRKDGVPLVGADAATLTLTNAQPDDAGAYSVVVSNGLGSVTNALPAILTLSAPPSITMQAMSQTVVMGNSATFSVTATGTPPLAYQWRKDGTNLTGATSSTLTIDHLQPGNAGGYSVVVSSSAGTVTSSTATQTLTFGTAVAWQRNIEGQTNVPAGLKAVVAVAAGGYHSHPRSSMGSDQ